MKLVDHNVVVIIFREFIAQILRVQTLNGAEKVFVTFRLFVSGQQFTKVLIPQDVAESKATLFQNFFPMNYKQKFCVRLFFANTLEIKGGNDSFSCTGGGDHQVLVAIVNFTFGADFIENFFLIRVRRNIHKRHVILFVVIFTAFMAQRLRQTLAGTLIIASKFSGILVRFKGGANFIPEVRRLKLTDFKVPFKSAGQRRSRDVG